MSYKKNKKIILLGLVVAAYALVITPLVVFNAQNRQDVRSRGQAVPTSSPISELNPVASPQSALAQCTAEGSGEIGVTYTNTNFNQTVTVAAMDQNTQQSINLGTINPGETKTDVIPLTVQSVPSGTIQFSVTQGGQTYQQTASYDATTCAAATTAPTQTPALDTSTTATCGNVTTDTVLVTDTSGSMGQSNKLVEAKNAGSNFITVIAKQQSSNRVGLVSFATTATLQNGLTTNYSLVKRTLNKLTASNDTCIQCAVDAANHEISTHGRKGVKKVVVLLTDGIANTIEGSTKLVNTNLAEQKTLEAAIAGHKANGAVFFVIGFGKDVNKAFLQKLATQTGGKFYFPAPRQLNSVYQDISELVGKGLLGGFVYNDANANGKYDTGEKYLSGWTIKLTSSAGTKTAKSDSNGEYTISGICDGSYSLSEVTPAGWTQTQPTSTAGYAITISNASQYTDKDFGNTDKILPKPTATPEPTATTVLNLTVFLHGIGASGDNANPTANSLSNKNPKHKTKVAQLELYNSANHLIATGSGNIVYNTTNGNFTGAVSGGSFLTSGNYTLKIKVDQYLRKLIPPGIVNIVQNRTNNLQAVSLVAGDINNDNKLSILDYNLLLDCYSDLAVAANCTDPSKKAATDINDDGQVNQIDYNLFLREISTQPGE